MEKQLNSSKAEGAEDKMYFTLQSCQNCSDRGWASRFGIGSQDYNCSVLIKLVKNDIQYTVIQYTVIQYTVIQYKVIQYKVIQYTVIQYTVIQYTVIQYTVIQYTVIQYTVGSI
jgi:hypothetical protein